MARIGVGVDFGTTNSVAAFYDGEQLRLVDLESSGSVMPSATYIDQELLHSVTPFLQVRKPKQPYHPHLKAG